MISGNLQDAAAVCGDWYRAEPSLTTFVLRSIFEDLVSRDWDDKQGVSTSIYQPFQDGVLPHLIQIADILSATPAAEPIGEVEALVVAYRDSLLSTP
jgi:hypothetical protein